MRFLVRKHGSGASFRLDVFHLATTATRPVTPKKGDNAEPGRLQPIRPRRAEPDRRLLQASRRVHTAEAGLSFRRRQCHRWRVQHLTTHISIILQHHLPWSARALFRLRYSVDSTRTECSARPLGAAAKHFELDMGWLVQRRRTGRLVGKKPILGRSSTDPAWRPMAPSE
jgi:hypothetical protein